MMGIITSLSYARMTFRSWRNEGFFLSFLFWPLGKLPMPYLLYLFGLSVYLCAYCKDKKLRFWAFGFAAASQLHVTCYYQLFLSLFLSRIIPWRLHVACWPSQQLRPATANRLPARPRYFSFKRIIFSSFSCIIIEKENGLAPSEKKGSSRVCTDRNLPIDDAGLQVFFFCTPNLN